MTENLSHDVPHAAFTEADYNSWRFRKDAVHFNGGKVFFGWGHRCVDQPRLLVIDKYFKKDRSTHRAYLVDGKTQCLTLLHALVALSTPPALTDFEIQLLSTISRDWYRPRRTRAAPATRGNGHDRVGAKRGKQGDLPPHGRRCRAAKHVSAAGVDVNRPSTYPRQTQRFFCLRCGAYVVRPDADRFEAEICLNCWFGRVRGDGS